jgi:hypothetical protein
MSRTLTSLNPNHPKTWLSNTKQAAKNHFRSLSTADLRRLAGEPETTHRHHCVEKLLARVVDEFKQSWQARYGWPFDDVLDSSKFHRHLAEAKIKQQGGPPMVDALQISDLEGRPLSLQEFELLPAQEQEDIRNLRRRMLHAVCLAGFGGMTPEGTLVDRRVHPSAMPIAANFSLRIPEPVAVANDPHLSRSE